MTRTNFKEGSMPYLFEKLAHPNSDGISRWVSKNEFVGEYGMGQAYCDTR